MESSIRKYVAELFGTMVLTLFGCGAALMTGVDPLATGLGFGISVMAMSVVIGHISGCHINPAITIAMFLAKKIGAKDTVCYIIFQIIGAIIAGLILIFYQMAVYDISFSQVLDYAPLAANTLDGVHGSAVYGLIAEIIMTFVFVTIVFGATDAKYGMEKFGGFFIGLGLTAIIMLGLPLTGTSVNPARSIGVGIFQHGAIGDLWVFIVAPIIGGILAWAFYRYVLSDHEG